MNKRTVPAGTYTITIHDLHASIHDYHLTGPGVNTRTGVIATGTTTWVVTLEKGTYIYVCDPHRSFMIGELKSPERGTRATGWGAVANSVEVAESRARSGPRAR